MVNIHRGNDANLVALLLVELLRNGLIGHITVQGHILMTPLSVFLPEAMEVAVEAESGQKEVLS